MKILDVFGVRLKALIAENEQSANELLIELGTFFYKIDNRISLEEKEYMDNLMADIEWASSTSIETYQKACIARVNKIVDAPESETFSYLTDLMDSLAKLGAVEKAQMIAQEISDADGEISDEEVKYLDTVLAYS